MKNITKLLVITLALVLLAGCGNKSTKVSNPNEVIITVGNQKITKQDLYQSMIGYDQGASAVAMIDEYIVDKEVETTQDIIDEATETIEELRKAGSLETTIKNYGFETEEELKEYFIKVNKTPVLYDKYFAENKDNLFTEHNPIKLKMIVVEIADDSAAANEKTKKAIEEIKAGAKFEDVAEKYSSDKTLAEEKLYVKSTISDTNVLGWVNTTKDNLSSSIAGADGKHLYVVQIIERNAEKLVDEFKAYLESQSSYASEVSHYYANLHNVQFYDYNVYQAIKSGYPEYLKDSED